MAYRIKNLTGIPQDVPTLAGPAILPAYGELASVELSAFEAEVMRLSPDIEISEAGAPDAPANDIDKLRADAEGLGIAVDGRWNAKRIQVEIDKRLAE